MGLLLDTNIQQAIANNSGFSFNVTVNNTYPNRCLYLLQVGENVGGGVPNYSTPTFNGVSMTLIGTLAGVDDTHRRLRLAAFRLVNPSVGTFTCAGGFNATVYGSVSVRNYFGVDQSTPVVSGSFQTFGYSIGQPSISVPTVTGSILLDLVINSSVTGESLTEAAGQSLLYTQSNGGNNYVKGSTKIATGNPTSMSWTKSGSVDFVTQMGFALRPAATGGLITVT